MLAQVAQRGCPSRRYGLDLLPQGDRQDHHPVAQGAGRAGGRSSGRAAGAGYTGIKKEPRSKARPSCRTSLLAIIDLLASSGMRVGEMVTLNREDINFNERECVVFGKGNKERLVYFDARTKIHLQNYLDERADNNPALFVTLKTPHERLMIGGVETMLRELGRRLNLNKVHPHKFRRTLATSAIDKGMPIEQVQQLLGHQKIDTTMHYAMVKQQNVKLAHRKFIE